LRLPFAERTEIVLVEGLLDVHHLRAKWFLAIAAIGSTRLHRASAERLLRLGFNSVVLAFDNDTPGREGAARAVDEIARASSGPAVRVLEPRLLGEAKDPDAFVRSRGVEAFRDLVGQAGCGISWRALEITQGVFGVDSAQSRRAALARAGAWLRTLSPRHALEQEDALRAVAERCGFSAAAVERAFRARFWDRCGASRPMRLTMER
jgi:DNA primase